MKTPILALAALAAALSGCVVDNYATPEFFGICVSPAPDTTTGACTYSSTCGTYTSGYAYDPTYPGSVIVPIEMFNQLPNNANPSALRVNTNDAVIQQWRLEYMVGGVAVATATAVTSTLIPAGTHTVAFVPVDVTPMFGLPFVLNVRAAGQYLDDRTFVTGAFGVPLSVMTYVPMTCTTGTAKACPRAGQESTQACVTG